MYLILVKRAARWEDDVLHGKLVGGCQEEVVEVPPRGGISCARVAVVHGQGAGFLAGVLVVLLRSLVSHRTHQVDDRVHGDDVANQVRVDVDRSKPKLSLR